MAERAVAMIDTELDPNAHNLAMCVRAEIEEAIDGRSSARLAYARHLAGLRWQARASALAHARSVRDAERTLSEHSILSQHAFLDDLTQLSNRRALLRHLEGLVSRPTCLAAIVLLDIDDFKAVNDTHGHLVGDRTLVRVGEILRRAVRTDDLAVRLGGDEFLLLLAGTELGVAQDRAEGIVEQVAAVDWQLLSSGLRVTVSAGVAAGDPRDYDTLLVAADVALYGAKRDGGNAVRVAVASGGNEQRSAQERPLASEPRDPLNGAG